MLGFSDSNRHSSRQRLLVEELTTRTATLTQENRVLKVNDLFSVLRFTRNTFQIEVDKFKIQVAALTDENRRLRQASVNIQARAEQEEEFISNTLLKKIQELKKEKVNKI